MQPPAGLYDISQTIPNIILDIPYAGTDNFTGKKLYNHQLAWLRAEPLEKLVAAAREFADDGFYVVVFDAYRPPSVQQKLREAFPDERFVRLVSNHCRGITVDITLADSHGVYLDMGTDYDDFSPKAHPNTGMIDASQQSNRQLLKSVMLKCGFSQHEHEWWHFDLLAQLGADIIDDELNVYNP